MDNREKLKDLIPWYVNGTLSGSELAQVHDYCTNDPDGRTALEDWLRVRNFYLHRDNVTPSAQVEIQILDQIRIKSIADMRVFHPYALALSTVILLLLWIIIRPGVILQWQGFGADPSAYRVYRSGGGSGSYQLLDEVPVTEMKSSYSYIDLFIWPFKDYSYYVEGINQSGSLGISQFEIAQAIQVLPGQLSLVCASLSMGYGVILVIRYRRLLLLGSLKSIAI